MRCSQEVLSGDFTLQLQNLATTIKNETITNQKIADADPLTTDEIFQRLPELNTQQDTESIRLALAQAVARASAQIEWGYVTGNAAIRDISMLGASLIRFDIEPADCTPGFSETLFAISSQVEGKIPRDSFIDYTSRNPRGTRERTFTPLPEEKLFIESLRRGMSALDNCLADLLRASTFPISRPEFATFMQAATSGFQDIIDAMVQVKRGITPEAFTHHIRPFFEPFRIGERPFSAPSGAEMPILNIDQIIWGSDCTDELYTVYFQANILRLPVSYQEASQLCASQESLITALKKRLTDGIPLSATERNSIQELHNLLTRMYTFRMPHYKVAEENVMLRQRENGEEHEVKGSGGFGLLETKYVLDKTIECRQVTARALAQ